jgi:hypothetical protein
MDAFSAFRKSYKDRGSLKTISIDVSVIPYKALFIADPFVYNNNGALHILCEVFVSQKDKRIAHIKQNNDTKWIFVRDVIKELNVSFPAIYPIEKNSNEVIIIPQVSNQNSIMAWKYSLVGDECALLWKKDVPFQTHDILFVNHTPLNKTFVVYGRHNEKKLMVLCLRELEYNDLLEEPHWGPEHVLGGQKLLRRKISKYIKFKRLTYRPAGNVIGLNQKGFIIPIQATKTGKYGELFALVFVSLDNYHYRVIDYISPCFFGDFERTHHLSWVLDVSGEYLFCSDVFVHNQYWKLMLYK